MFVQQLVKSNSKEILKALYITDTLWRESTSDRWIHLTKISLMRKKFPCRDLIMHIVNSDGPISGPLVNYVRRIPVSWQRSIQTVRRPCGWLKNITSITERPMHCPWRQNRINSVKHFCFILFFFYTLNEETGLSSGVLIMMAYIFCLHVEYIPRIMHRLLAFWWVVYALGQVVPPYFSGLLISEIPYDCPNLTLVTQKNMGK